MDLGEQVLERHRSEGWNRLDGYHDVELVIERLPEKVSAPCGDPGVLPPVEQAEAPPGLHTRSEEHTSELQSHHDLVCRLLLEKKKKKKKKHKKKEMR